MYMYHDVSYIKMYFNKTSLKKFLNIYHAYRGFIRCNNRDELYFMALLPYFIGNVFHIVYYMYTQHCRLILKQRHMVKAFVTLIY